MMRWIKFNNVRCWDVDGGNEGTPGGGASVGSGDFGGGGSGGFDRSPGMYGVGHSSKSVFGGDPFSDVHTGAYGHLNTGPQISKDELSAINNAIDRALGQVQSQQRASAYGYSSITPGTGIMAGTGLVAQGRDDASMYDTVNANTLEQRGFFGRTIDSVLGFMGFDRDRTLTGPQISDLSARGLLATAQNELAEGYVQNTPDGLARDHLGPAMDMLGMVAPTMVAGVFGPAAFGSLLGNQQIGSKIAHNIANLARPGVSTIGSFVNDAIDNAQGLSALGLTGTRSANTNQAPARTGGEPPRFMAGGLTPGRTRALMLA